MEEQKSTYSQGEQYDKLIQSRKPTKIILKNGVQMSGVVVQHDNYTVTIEFQGKQQMIFKQAISTVVL